MKMEGGGGLMVRKMKMVVWGGFKGVYGEFRVRWKMDECGASWWKRRRSG